MIFALSEEIRLTDTSTEQQTIVANVATKSLHNMMRGKQDSRGRGQHNRSRGRSNYGRGTPPSSFNQTTGRLSCPVYNRVGYTAFQCYHRSNHAFMSEQRSIPNALYATQSYAVQPYPTDI